MVLVAAVALGSSTYAWFVNNTKVTAEAAKMTAKTAYTLQISQGEKASNASSVWATTHTWADGATAKELSPVSTIGALNGSNLLDFMTDDAWITAAADATNVSKGGTYANTFKTAEDTQYIKESFEIKASQPCQLILDSDTAVTAGASELDRVLRMALVITDKDDNTTVNFYEVNDGAATETGYNTTSTDADGISKAINSSGVVATLDSGVIYSTLADGKNTGNGASAIMPKQTGTSVLYTFTEAEEYVTVTAYIWMEGCDYDCTAVESSHFANGSTPIEVTATLGFSAALNS